MLRKIAVLSLLVAFVVGLSTTVFAKEGRVEGAVVRHNADKGTIVVRVRSAGSADTVEKTVHYDASTKFNAAYHGEKTVKDITAADVKDGDQVICIGSYDAKNDFNASLISKRLSHSPKE